MTGTAIMQAVRAHPWARLAAAPILFAGLVALGGQIRIPIPGNPIPLTLQLVAVLLAGAFLRPAAAASSMALFLTAGALGAPVFAGGGLGAGWLVGPTGGYLIGFVPAAFAGAVILSGRRRTLLLTALAMTVSTLIVHLSGALHLALYLGSLETAVRYATTPFLAGDVLKIAVAAAAVSGSAALHPVVDPERRPL